MFKILSGECNFLMGTGTEKLTDTSELSCQYDWYSENFAHKIKDIAEDFFDNNFSVHLLGICKNVNSLAGKESYFVTKVKVDKQYDVFFRLSDAAVKVILEKVLGKTSRQFDLERLTDFETKLLTTFNSVMFRGINENLKEAPPTLTRKNFNVIYLLFVVNDSDNKTSGRFTVCLPEELLDAKKIEDSADFPTEIFEKSIISVKLEVGETKFKLHELKNIEVGDTVVFETSEAGKLHLKYMDYEKDVLLEDNPAIIMQGDYNGGNDMPDENINIWDSIEVEMSAHFDAVNITLGDLKKIHAGKVIEIASVYQNNVTLTVEDKTIAHGELVIINDKYGVRVTDVVVPTADTTAIVQQSAKPVSKQTEETEADENAENAPVEGEVIPSEDEHENEEEEFDYSDFDLEEDI